MLKKEVIDCVIGKGFADKIDEPLFHLGQSGYSRRFMVENLGCANFIAAVKLGKVLKRLKITSILQLARTDPMSLARAKGIGEASLFVAMCILEAGNYDPVKWWTKNDNVVKFSTFKHHAIQRASRRKQEVA